MSCQHRSLLQVLDPISLAVPSSFYHRPCFVVSYRGSGEGWDYLLSVIGVSYVQLRRISERGAKRTSRSLRMRVIMFTMAGVSSLPFTGCGVVAEAPARFWDDRPEDLPGSGGAACDWMMRTRGVSA